VGTLAWHRAATLLGLFSGFAAVSRDSGISSTLPQVPDDWPDTFRVDQLARLQRPGKDESQERAAIERALEADIGAGRLDPAGTERVCTFASIGSELSAAMDGLPYRRHFESYRTVPTLTREAFAAWLRAQGEAPSEHVRAWFGELPPVDEDAALGRATRKQRADFRRLGQAAREGIDWTPLIKEGRRLLTEKKAHSKRQAAAMVAKNHPGVNADTLRLKL
jgi:hypothetical protein